MNWQYDDEGCWRANSRHANNGVAMYVSGDGNTPPYYLIYVSEDGEFVVGESALVNGKSFSTLDAAKAFCAGNERDIAAEAKEYSVAVRVDRAE
jgi:uncharacterized Zn finger protein